MRRGRRIALSGAASLVALAAWLVTPGLGLPFPPWPPGGVFATWHPLLFGLNLGLTYLAALAIHVLWGEDTKRRAGNAAVAAAAPALCIGVLELPALFDWIDYRHVLHTEIDWTPFEGEHNQLDRELIHIRPPHSRVAGTTSGDMTAFGVGAVRTYEIDYRYDRNGFRNPVAYDSATVVLSGDSFLEALLVPVEEGVSLRLEERLGRPVYHLGQSNWGPRHQVVALRRHGLPLRPTAVVWFFFEGNDLDDIEVYDWTRRNYERQLEIYDSFWRRSFVRNGLRLAALLTNEDPRLERRRSCRLPDPPEESPRRLYFLYEGEPLTAEQDSLLALAQDEILAGRAEARAAGAEFALVFIPIKYRVYADLCTAPEGSDLTGWVRNDLPRRMERFAAEHEIPYLDLTPALREASRAGTLTYFEDDTHWTPAGHAVAADAVLGLLRSAVPGLTADGTPPAVEAGTARDDGTGRDDRTGDASRTTARDRGTRSPGTPRAGRRP